MLILVDAENKANLLRVEEVKQIAVGDVLEVFEKIDLELIPLSVRKLAF